MLGALLLLLFFSPALAKFLASGGTHTIVVQRNGQVFGTGNNLYGQLGLNISGTYVFLPHPMLLASNIVDASCGEDHTCLVDQDGKARCVGENKDGQLGVGAGHQPPPGDYEYEGHPSKPNSLLLPVSGIRTAVAKVYCSVRVCCAKLVDGRAKCWGSYLGEYVPSPREITGLGSHGVRDIALGSRHACFVTVRGKLYCVGTENDYGQLGIGSYLAKRVPTPVVGLAANNIVSVACGELHTCAVNEAGAMFCWGNNENKLGAGTLLNSNVPLQVVGLTAGVASAWASTANSFAILRNGTVMVFGNDMYYGLHGTGSIAGPQPLPIVFGLGVTGVLEVRGGYQHTCVLLQDQVVKCTGSGEDGQLGVGDLSSSLVLVPMVGIPATKAPTPNPAWNQPTSSPTPPVNKRLAGMWRHFVMLQRDGQVYGVGDNHRGQLGLDSLTDRIFLPQQMLAVSNARDISAGQHHTCVVDQGGQAKCVGWDRYGQVGGDTSTTIKRGLIPVMGLNTGVAEIVCGHSTSCAIMENGRVQCWGKYLGKSLSVPLDIIGLGNNGIKAVSLGRGFSCFLAVGGRLYCIGYNFLGQLGTVNTTFATTPMPVVGLASENIVSVACGGSHTCAVNQQGTMFCWGNGENGRLGNGVITGNYPNPIQVAGLTSNVASVWVSGTTSFALLRNGTVMMFGEDIYGASKSLPIVFGDGVMGVMEVRGGQQTACVLLQNDQVQCSGTNDYGQLGLGTEVERSVPLVPMKGIPVTKAPTPNPAWNQPTASPTPYFVRGHKRLAGMGYHFVVLQRDGQAYGTGRNDEGQLGVGSGRKVYFPTLMLRVSNATDVSAGYTHTCLMDQDDQVKCVGRGDRGQLGDGSSSRKNELVTAIDSGVAEVYCGGEMGCARMQNGEAKCWGNYQSNPTIIPGLGEDGVKDISVSYGDVCFVTAAGKVFCFGSDKYTSIRFDGTSPRSVSTLENIVSVACSGWDMCAVNNKGAMFCWTSVGPPERVMGFPSNIVSVWLGGSHTFALLSNDRVMAFGSNYYGELGLGNTKYQASPVAFGKGVSRIREIRGGEETTCILLRGDGTVKCTGRNQYGQMGIEKLRKSSTLMKMVGLPTTRAPAKPTAKPITAKPTKAKSTSKPTKAPSTSKPTTSKPTKAPSTSKPTKQ
ncbi:hypothetical protein BASA81_000699 [Batrachochytrium salamandrivorans]|nr:hypothetical protein BASA81_000699 [Batrachochytrium salamandrivorans]